MILIPASICLLLFVFGIWSIGKTSAARNWFLHPAAGFGLLNVLTLSIRGYSSEGNWIPSLVSRGIQQEVLYYNCIFFSLYFIALHVTILRCCRKRQKNEVSHSITKKNRLRLKTSIFLLATAVLLAFILGTYFGLFHSLGQEAKSQNLGFIDSAIRLGFEIRWVLTGFCIVGINRFPKFAWAFLLLVLATETLITLQHGGRGHVFTAFRVFCAAVAFHSKLTHSIGSILSRKAKYLIPLGVGAFVLIVVVTALRNQKAYDDNVMSLQGVQSMASSLADQSFEEVKEPLESMITRLSYPYDNHGLVLLARRDHIPKRDYLYGSFPDGFKFIPRILWPGKPTSSFNYWMSQYLLGRRGNNTFDLPIGRVSEADYAFGKIGVLFGIFYGFLFGYIYSRFFVMSDRYVSKVIYVALFFAFIIAGAACLTNRIPIITQFLVATAPILFWIRRVKI